MSPYVSIVYLTKNGGELFEESIKAVFSQRVSFEYEVIVVDSGSNDCTLEILKNYPVHIYSVSPSSFNFGLTRDYGFSLSKGEFVVAISQDALPVGDEWLANLIAPFQDPEIAAVQGIDVVPPRDDVFYWDRIGLMYYTRESKAWIQNHDKIGMSFTCCAIRRTVWEQNPLGRIEMSEDKVFQKKISEKGHKIFFQRKARDYHYHVYTVIGLAKRCMNEGLGWKIVNHHYPFFDMIRDLINPQVLRALYEGIVGFKIVRPAELVFPVLRPIFVYIGNSWVKKYIR